MLEQVDESIAISAGNPLLESSIDGMQKTQAELENQADRIQVVKDNCLEIYENISEFLSVPSSLRGSGEIDLTAKDVGNTYNEIKSSFDYLVSFNKEYLRLSMKGKQNGS